MKDQIPPSEKQWYAVKCKFRCEKRLLQELEVMGVEVYVPFINNVKSGRAKAFAKPKVLIPSHVFVRINRSSYIPILRHPHVFSFLHFSGQLSCIREKEMNIMKRVVGEIDDIAIDHCTYLDGDKVQIIGGHLTGIEGYIVQSGKHNVKIELTSFGLGLCISVDPKLLIKVGKSHIKTATKEEEPSSSYCF